MADASGSSNKNKKPWEFTSASEKCFQQLAGIVAATKSPEAGCPRHFASAGTTTPFLKWTIGNSGMIRLALAFIVFACCVEKGTAATRIWSGSNTPYLNNPANWVGGIVPVAGDSIEFPDDARFTTVINDLDGEGRPSFSMRSIIFKGYNYTLRGRPLFLQGGIQSLYSRATIRIECDVNINPLYPPYGVSNYGYFGHLEIAGRFEVGTNPLLLNTSSTILITGRLISPLGASVTKTQSGVVTFNGSGLMMGKIFVEGGTLIIPNETPHDYLSGSLTIGNDTDPPGTARVRWDGTQRVNDQLAVTINRSGVMDLKGPVDSLGISVAVANIRGDGVINLNAAELVLTLDRFTSSFSGVVTGTGGLRLGGDYGGLELTGHNPFEGVIHTTGNTTLRLFGSASNAAVVLDPGTSLRGGGVAKSLVATAATVFPGPGKLRILESCSLNQDSSMSFVLDGPAASMIETGALDLGNCRLEFIYTNTDETNMYTLISAATSAGATFRDAPEGAWLFGVAAEEVNEFQLTYSGTGRYDVLLERFGVFEPPRLRVSRLPDNQHIIAWPLSARGYSLQRSLSIILPDWGVGGGFQVSTSATEHFVIGDADNDGVFYRLKR